MTEQERRYLLSLTPQESTRLARKIMRRLARDGSWDWPTLHAVYPQTAMILRGCIERSADTLTVMQQGG